MFYSWMWENTELNRRNQDQEYCQSQGIREQDKERQAVERKGVERCWARCYPSEEKDGRIKQNNETEVPGL